MPAMFCTIALLGTFAMFGEGDAGAPSCFVLIGEPPPLPGAPGEADPRPPARRDLPPSVELRPRSAAWSAGPFRAPRCTRGRCARW